MTTTKINQFMASLAEVEDHSVAPFAVAEPTASHKLTFLCVRARNFRSIGDNWLELSFVDNQSTLIVSDDNGAGKSTLTVWAAYYALTGKPYGDKEKVTSLINTTNRNNMVVELEFLKSGVHYKIVRGRKPDIFEIQVKQDGVFKTLDDDAAKKDWQEYLWGLIGLDRDTGPKLIENVIILGKDKFKPFIEMGAEDRRKMVEPIWDLGIFTDMNEQLKISRKETSTELDEAHIAHREAEHKVELKRGEINAADVTVQANESLRKSAIDIAQRDVDEAKETLDKANKSLDGVEASLKGFKDDCEERVAGIRARAKKHAEGLEQRVKEAVASVSAQLVSKQDARSANSATHQSNISDIVERRKVKEAEQEEVIAEIEAEVQVEHNKVSEIEAKLNDPELGDESVLQGEINTLNAELSELTTKHNGLNTHKTRFQTALEGIQSSLAKLNELGDCPTCQQVVSDEHKEAIAAGLQPSIDEHVNNIARADEALEKNAARANEINVELEKLNSRLREVREAKQALAIELSESKVNRDAVMRRLSTARELLERVKSESREEYSREEKRFTDTNSRLDLEIHKLKEESGQVEAERRSELEAEGIEIAKELSRAGEVYDRKVEEERFKANEAIDFWTEKLDKAKAHLEDVTDDMNQTVENSQATLDALHEELEAYQANVTEAVDLVNKLTKDLEDWDALKTLISDKEGKADIIRRYMPFLNNKINEYLEAMNMFISFEMDEAFNAKMNAPDRQNQTLFSLSSGQRARVNMAIVFALRDVANLKASVQTNLLVLDEVLENMSERGVLESTTMIKEKFQSSNLFVITQRAEEFQEHFHTMIKYGLRGGYTAVI